ncbi:MULTISPECIES: hypothetical protein [unclassified Streptomyces]|uniref:hypothetical protein n=1 Tax=unclassified Streptomyces TaxID=2593676 RepID=UPI00093DFD6F|nr:hypothetical protein [Streptomyces sp. TSRI0281]OKI35055.1 hypothetical protein A6A29_16685 [Streptomyces sp. TSRI0281]
MSVEVNIDSRFIERALRRPGGIGERLLRRRAAPVVRRAEQLAPGSMARGITLRVEGTGREMQAIITSTHPASLYVINGTRPHVIRPRRARALRFQAGGRTVFAARVNHPGNAANNFLARAVREAL